LSATIPEKKEETTMKKMFATATALMFVVGLTIAAQAQTAVDKSKTTPALVQKVATQETGKEAAKAEVPKGVPAEAKKVEPTATGMKEASDIGKKAKETAGTADKQTGKEVKTTAAPEKKAGLETPKTDKK
jgi:hypothetical protein